MDGTDSATARHEDEAKRNTNGTADVIDRKGFAETYTVEECCEILDSQRVPIKGSERSAGEYPYYGANGIQDYVDDYIFDDELVLLAEDGGNFGSKIRPIAYRVSGKCWVNNHAHVLKPKSMIDVDYLCYSLMFYDTNGLVNGAKFEISYKLQDIDYQIDRLIAYRKALVKQMSEKVQELPRDNFAVRQHLKYVDLYATEANYQVLTYEDTLIVREEVAPLILPDGDEASAVRFDALMYGIELAYLIGKKYTRARSDLHKKVAGIASVANIPEIQAQSELINKILNTDYVDNAGINEFEEIREKLRDLMKYIPRGKIKYETNFSDELLSATWKESELENDELKNYKAKAEYYIRQHQDNVAIAKLKTNQPLTETDIETLEEILWKEVGTKQDYEHEIGTKPLGEFVREIVGLDMNAAKEAFSEYLTSTSLDSRQIYFVNQIVEYIVHNGMMKDLSVLQESPFTDQGSVVEIFTDLTVWMGIRKVIESINANAAA